MDRVLHQVGEETDAALAFYYLIHFGSSMSTTSQVALLETAYSFGWWLMAGADLF
jgi:hypothetical protein